MIEPSEMVAIGTSSKRVPCSSSSIMISRAPPIDRSQVTARLLVLGGRQVGKSASIVRYTTGRFIGEYCAASSDWLYRRSLNTGGPPVANVELLEQRDIQLNPSPSGSMKIVTSNSSSSSNSNRNSNNDSNRNSNSICTSSSNSERESLALRVAKDQISDQQLHEKQQMLEKVRWADGFIVIYSINDVGTFEKAAKYLELILAAIEPHNQAAPAVAEAFGSASSRSEPPPRRRPILLLANKLDLDAATNGGDGGRQVSESAGSQLAQRHRSMFAEVSVAQSGRQLETALADLVELLASAGAADLICAAGNNYEQLITSCTSKQRPAAAAAAKGNARKCSTPSVSLWRKATSSAEQLAIPAKPATSLGSRSSSGSSGSSCGGGASSGSQMQSLAARLVRSQPLCSSSLAQSCRVSLLTAQDAQQQQQQPAQRGSIPGAAAATANTLKRSSLESIALAKQQQPQPQPPPPPLANNHRSNRYENFKSSFKKASKAIVNSRALTAHSGKKQSAAAAAAAAAQLAADQQLQRQQLELAASYPASGGGAGQQTAAAAKVATVKARSASSEQALPTLADDHSTTPAKHRNSATWLRNHMRLSRGSKVDLSASGGGGGCGGGGQMAPSSSDPKLTDLMMAARGSSGGTAAGLPPAMSGETSSLGDRIRRPLLKYKSRRKTVAFEPISVASVDALGAAGSDIGALRPTTGGGGGGAACTQFARKSSLIGDHVEHQQQPATLGDSNNINNSNHSNNNNNNTTSSSNGSYNTTRNSSARSSSSLSTSDTYHSSLLMYKLSGGGAGDSSEHRAPSSVGSMSVCSSNYSNTSGSQAAAATGHHMPASGSNTTTTAAAATSTASRYYSRPGTLSRGSTSGGSFSEDTSADEQQQQQQQHYRSAAKQLMTTNYAIQRVSSDVASKNSCRTEGRTTLAGGQLAAMPSSSSLTSGGYNFKKRYQLVKSVHNTLSNLTRSSNVTGQAVKRSLCTGLFRGHSNTLNNNDTTTATATITPASSDLGGGGLKRTPLVADLANVEQVARVMPMVVGYCK